MSEWDGVVDDYLDLRFCYKLTSLPNLKCVGGEVSLFCCYNLKSIPKLESVGGNLGLYGCTNLTSLENLTHVDGDLDLTNCNKFIEFDDNLTVASEIYINYENPNEKQLVEKFPRKVQILLSTRR